MPYRLHVVSETHWDREWYLTYQEFRLKLVDLIDDLLQLFEDDPDYRHFVLDGQAVMLEDYLEIRPETRDEITRLVREGRLGVGPWYVLADEFLASPESHIRNMQIGLLISRQFGREVRVGYLPDEFGHVSQMPQILKGFGIDCAFMSRGFHATRHDTCEFWWTSPDGSRVLAHCQPYGLEGKLPEDIEAGVAQLHAIKNTYSNYLEGNAILVMNGADHLEPQPQVIATIDAFNAGSDDVAIHSTLDSFFSAVLAIKPTLKPVYGELREEVICHPISLYGVHSSRMYIKQANQRASDSLERWAEPFCALAWMLGAKHPSAQLTQAWKYHVQNLAHDSICGCSTDRVHDQMMTRFESAQEIADALTRRSFDFILNKAAQSAKSDDEVTFAVFNPSTFARSQTQLAVIDAPKGWPATSRLSLLSDAGDEVMLQPVDWAVDAEIGISHFTLGSEQRINPRTFYFVADSVPPMGYRLYRLCRRPQNGVDAPFRHGSNWAENGFVRFAIESDGSITLTDKITGHTFAGLHTFEDDGDNGGGYDYLRPEQDTLYSSTGKTAKITVAEVGPALIRFRIELSLRLPVALTRDRKRRQARTKPVRIVTYVSLGAVGRTLEFHTIVDNLVTDHRLRVCFATHLRTDVAHVDGHFDVLERSVLSGVKPWPTEHQRRFIDLSDGQSGLAVINHGLPEYEVTDDTSRTIKLTLFRSNSYMTREWWPTIRTPKAEMMGRSTYQYAVYPHAGDWTEAGVIGVAELTAVPMRVHQCANAGMESGCGNVRVWVDSQAAVTSIVKKCDHRDSLVLRLYNPNAAPTEAGVSLGAPIVEAHAVDLEENRVRSLVVTNGELAVNVPPKAIVTVEIVIGSHA